MQIWLRALDDVTARPLAVTVGGSGSFWSPDSKSIGFCRGDQAASGVDLSGGAAITVGG